MTGRLSGIVAVLAACVFTFGLLVSPPSLSAATTVRIMPLGDSITGSPGCWRALLWNKLQSNGYQAIDFVGTLPTQGCGVAHDGDNEGHGGFLATNVADQNQLPGWLAATLPDIVIMHFGTNDVWSNRPTGTILAAFTKLVGQMRASNPAMKIIVAQIIPMNPSSCPECAARVVSLNQAVPAWAAGLTTPQSPITVVDQWTGFNTATDTGDGVHPTDSGNQKISDRWYPALAAALGTTSTPTPTPTTPTPPGEPSGVTCTLAITNEWPGGFQAAVTVRNNGAPVTSWRVRLDLAATWTIGSAWNAVLSRGGTTVSLTSASWNGALPTGGTAIPGLTATGSGPLPTGCSPY